MNANNINTIGWDKLTKSKKGVRCINNWRCGNVIARSRGEIVIVEGALREHEYRTPKSNVTNCNGAEMSLGIPYSVLSATT
jgi:hypothetical protein